MILWELFYTFFKIGLFTFGGGYAMISIIRDECLAHGWLTEGELMNFIAVSESTPGPFAINMATFVGSSQGGVLGSALATFGIVLPSFIIILIIAMSFKNLTKYKGTQALLAGIRPVVIGLILATATTIFLSTILGITTLKSGVSINFRAIGIFVIITAVATVYKKIKKTAPSPVLLIILSAVLGIIAY